VATGIGCVLQRTLVMTLADNFGASRPGSRMAPLATSGEAVHGEDMIECWMATVAQKRTSTQPRKSLCVGNGEAETDLPQSR
jgi:hypothetical protein